MAHYAAAAAADEWSWLKVFFPSSSLIFSEAFKSL